VVVWKISQNSVNTVITVIDWRVMTLVTLMTAFPKVLEEIRISLIALRIGSNLKFSLKEHAIHEILYVITYEIFYDFSEIIGGLLFPVTST
jgi:hypothetical protein